MLPFSVLRVWILGLASWLLIGVGIYLAYDTYRAFDTNRVVVTERQQRPSEDQTDTESPEARGKVEVVQPRDATPDSRRWWLLAGTIACFATSVGGFWPVSFL